jgi:alkylation response protein AidB-like acyl-CoA dehydrogenase
MTETLGQFRLRASTWMEANLPRLPDGYDNRRLDLEDPWGKRSRRLQRLLFDAGFAGLCFPKEYKGQGLDPSYQQAFTEVSRPYQMPTLFNVPTLSILAPTLLDFGTEAQ